MLKVQLNVSSTAILETDESGRGREVAIVQRFKTRVNVWNVRQKVAVERRPLVEVRLAKDTMRLLGRWLNFHSTKVIMFFQRLTLPSDGRSWRVAIPSRHSLKRVQIK